MNGVNGAEVLEEKIHEQIICANRFYRKYKKCEKCERDYNPEHHPNNLDCGNYKEVRFYTFFVEDEEVLKQ